MVMVYVPAKIPAKVGLFTNDPLFNLYLYGATPPEAIAEIVVLPPKVIILPALMVKLKAEGWVIFKVTDFVAPRASVTVNVLVPAKTEKVPVPLYGVDPPVALTVTVELAPLQFILVEVAFIAKVLAGCVMVIDLVIEQGLLSLITME
jgi:hypothetical protein